MRVLLGAFLLATLEVLLSQCSLKASTATPAKTENTTTSVAVASPHPIALPGDTVQVGQAQTFDPDPNIPYREVKLADVMDAPTGYVALLPCKRDSTGALFLQVELNPQQHSLEKLSLQYAGASPKKTVKQVGDGTGHYDPKTQRYYFTVLYQIISELPDKRRNFSHPYPVHGWVSTQTNTAGLQPVTF